jgi:YVTN family beta-propeller protein
MHQGRTWAAVSLGILGGLMAASPLFASDAYVWTCSTVPSAVSVISRADHSVSKTLVAGQGALFAALTPNGAMAYVANEDAQTVSVLDTTSGAQIASIPLTHYPYAAVVSPDGSRVYVAGTLEEAGPIYLTAIDTATNTIIFDDSVPGAPNPGFTAYYLPSPAISRDGQTLYIVGDRIVVFDVTTQTVTGTVSVASVHWLQGFAVAPDDSYAVVTGNENAFGEGWFALVDLQTMTMVSQISVGTSESVGPAVFSPDGSLVYFISNQTSSTNQILVRVVDMASRRIVSTFNAGKGHGIAIAITPDGSELEVGNDYNATVVSVNAYSGGVIATVAALGDLYNLTVSADGEWIYVPDYDSSMVQVIQPETGQIKRQIPAAAYPSDVFAAPAVVRVSADGTRAIATGRASLSIIDTQMQQLIGAVPLGGLVVDAVLAPHGNVAYVLNKPDTSPTVAPLIQVVDTQKQRVVAGIALTTADYATHLALSPDAETLYVTDQDCAPVCGAQVLKIVSTATLQITGQIPISSSTTWVGPIVLTKDGSTAYVSSANDSNQGLVSVIDLTLGQVATTIPFLVGTMALAPNQQLLYGISDGVSVEVFDLQQGAVTANLNTGIEEPFDLAVSPDSQLVYVTNAFTDSMVVITAPPNGVPVVSGTITLPGLSAGAAFAP